MVVSDTQAKVYIKELSAYLVCTFIERWEDYAMNLVIVSRGRQGETPGKSKR